MDLYPSLFRSGSVCLYIVVYLKDGHSTSLKN